MSLWHQKRELLLSVVSLCALCVSAVPSQAQQKVTYEQHVLPVLRDKCLGCHNADKTRGGLDASTYGKLMEGGSSGAVVKPGDVDGSRLYTLAAHKEEPKMPPNAPQIAKASLDVFKAWIEAGAPESAGSKVNVPAKKADVGVKSVARGKPAVPPLPTQPLPQEVMRTPRANAVTALAASPWAPIVAVAAPKQVLLFRTDTLELMGALPFAHGQVNVLRFSRSGELLLAAGGRGGKSGKAVLYEIKTGKLVTEIGDETDAVLAADLSPDQSMVAVGGPNRIVRLYATADGSKVREMKKHTEWVTAIEFSPDGVLLATGDRNGGAVVWEANTGREYFVLAGHKAALTDLSWRDDANLLATASEDGSVKTWEMDDGKQTKNIAAHGGGTEGVKYAHDGRFATTGRDRRARLFDANGNAKNDWPGIPDMATKVAISHDGSLVFAGDWTGTVHVWSTVDGKKRGQFSTNPPTLEQRREIAWADLTAKIKAVSAAQVSYEQAKKAAETVNAEVSAAKKAVNDAQALTKQTANAVPAAKQALDQAQGKLASAGKSLQAAEVKASISAEAAAKYQAEADKAKDNPDLAALAADGKKQAAAAAQELDGARKNREQAQAEVKAADEKLAAARKAQEEAAARVKQVQDAGPAKAKAAQEAAAKVNAAKAALDKAIAERDAAKATLDRLIQG